MRGGDFTHFLRPNTCCRPSPIYIPIGLGPNGERAYSQVLEVKSMRPMENFRFLGNICSISVTAFCQLYTAL